MTAYQNTQSQQFVYRIAGSYNLHKGSSSVIKITGVLHKLDFYNVQSI